MKPATIGAFLLNLLLVAGCSSPVVAPLLTPTLLPSKTSTRATSPTYTGIPASTLLPPSMTPSQASSVSLSSPLQGIALAELPEIVTNPFQFPRPGQDSGHHGTDFAFYSHGSFMSILGMPVQAVLPGQVALVVSDRPPYGNALLIETPIEVLPNGVQRAILQMEPTPAPTTIPSLTCPTVQTTPTWDAGRQSVYLLYAHLAATPKFQMGDDVEGGEVIDQVGNSGVSSNPHLHLEVRIGPAGARFTGMSHYNNRA
ncbi:MAG: peptidoglycan DD-metalloendopeptidase family protein, partial [Anaerolineaceae bacterium]|nr:peptidoglycan DD-metalloendopeptidase family protein [Anaerolineaceae bacterium]